MIYNPKSWSFKLLQSLYFQSCLSFEVQIRALSHYGFSLILNFFFQLSVCRGRYDQYSSNARGRKQNFCSYIQFCISNGQNFELVMLLWFNSKNLHRYIILTVVAKSKKLSSFILDVIITKNISYYNKRLHIHTNTVHHFVL